jgi:hypothetical protein
MAIAWAVHPDLILVEVGCIIPEPEEPFVECEPPLFLSASELIHSKQDTLQFRAFIQIVEIHDFNRSDSSSDDSGDSSSDSGTDRILGLWGGSSLWPWPCVYRCVGEFGAPWPSLPTAGSGAIWLVLGSPPHADRKGLAVTSAAWLGHKELEHAPAAAVGFRRCVSRPDWIPLSHPITGVTPGLVNKALPDCLIVDMSL